MTPDELNKIKARCEAATKQTRPCSHRGCHSHRSHPCEGCGRQGGYASQTQLIAIVCKDLPDCIAEIERLRGFIERIATDKGGEVWITFSFNPTKEARKLLENK